MLAAALSTLLLATAAVAVPANVEVARDASYVPAHQFQRRTWNGKDVLLPHEVLLFGPGVNNMTHYEIIHEDHYAAMFKKSGLFATPSELLGATEGILSTRPDDEAWLINGTLPAHLKDAVWNVTDVEEIPGGGTDKLGKRCSWFRSVAVTTQQDFVDWDVQMAPVVSATGDRTYVSIQSGYSVANGVSVSAGLDWTIIEKVLSVSFKITYTTTWTTSYSASVMYQLTQGMHGTIVTNPTTHRKYGKVLEGCIGAQKQTGTFQADNHDEGSYGGIRWVQGAISLCQKFQNPLTRCQGSGTFR